MKFNFSPISDNERKEIENEAYKDYVKEKEEVVYRSVITYYDLSKDNNKLKDLNKTVTEIYYEPKQDCMPFKKKLKYKQYDKTRNINNIS